MKALDEYFLMVVFPLLLNRVRVFAIFTVNLNRESKRVKKKYFYCFPTLLPRPYRSLLTSLTFLLYNFTTMET